MSAEQAFTAYVTARRAHLVRMAGALVADGSSDADDLVQEALVRLAAHWRRARDPDAYVRKVLINLAVDRSRRRRVRPHLVAWTQALHDPVRADPAEDIVERSGLLDALRGLPLRQRQVLALRYLDGCSEEQTAALLGITTGAVKSFAHRGLIRLRTELAVPAAHTVNKQEMRP